MGRSRLLYSVRIAAVGAIAMTLACRSKDPRLSIFSPPASSHFVQGDTIHLASELNSELDPGVINDKDWRWASNLDGELGSGPRLDVTSLSVGKHQIRATAKHRLGISEDSVTVIVDPKPVK